MALTAGCAAPGAPQSPSLRLPIAVDNLSATRKGGRVLLTWSPPTETTDHQSIHWPTSTRICRVINQFPINACGEVVKELKSSELTSAVPTGARRPLVSFEDSLPPSLIAVQNQATYAVEVVNERGHFAGLSNQVRISLVPTAPPPANFHATLDAQGPLLEWNVVSSIVPAAGVSYRLRIYRRSRGKPEFAVVAEQPYRIGKGEARDSSFEWEQEYDYKIAAVTIVALPWDAPLSRWKAMTAGWYTSTYTTYFHRLCPAAYRQYSAAWGRNRLSISPGLPTRRKFWRIYRLSTKRQLAVCCRHYCSTQSSGLAR